MLICNSILKASRKLFLCEARHISSDLISCDLGRLFRKVFDAGATLKNAVRFFHFLDFTDTRDFAVAKCSPVKILHSPVDSTRRLRVIAREKTL